MKRINYYAFVCLFFLFIFQAYLERNVSVYFGYIDEAYALLIIPIILIKARKIEKVEVYDVIIASMLIILNIIGFISSYHNKIQSTTYIIQDFIIVNKFIASIYVSRFIFKDIFEVDNIRENINKICRFTTIIFFILTIMDVIFHIFKTTNQYRYGLKVVSLFYSHPTFLCATCVFILVTMLACKRKNDFKYYIMLSICIFFTLRFKAWIFIATFWIFYFILIRKNRKLKLSLIIFVIIAGFLIGESQFEFYFIENESSRGILLEKSFTIARDYFPLGGGFASYGSSASKDSYSILYYKYGLSHRYGLSKEYPYFISDNFWPMIIGQFGYLGCIIYIIMLIALYKKIQKIYSINFEMYIAALTSFTYPVILSTSVSGFVAPAAIPLAIIIGIAIGKSNIKENNEEN